MKALIKIEEEIIGQIGDEIEFKFDYENSHLVITLEDQAIYFNKESEDRMKYYKNYCRVYSDLFKFDKMELTGKLNCYSRIDKYPVLEVDFDLSEIRNKRIDSILSKN